jgi:general secretion pathway protein B
VSFILDALRKSEHERQRSEVPGLAQVPLATPSAQLPRWALLVMGLLGATVLVLGGAWWQSTRVPPELAAVPASVERPLPLPAPDVAPPTGSAANRAAPVRAPAPQAVAPAGEQTLAAAAAPTSTESADAEPTVAPPAGTTTVDAATLPSVAALVAEGIVLPQMNLELLAFREQARDRFVFINGRKYVEGERLVEGPQLVSIGPMGAVLLHAGRRFMLVSQ